ncbi:MULTISPECIES: ABC transporter substrate-binding protein [Paenibacillus]|uniref:ABC transporter substrate-binding protein n=1 Tax=Paenibacillus TaxID=44249 RepID=UPI0022B8C37A|nr:extracellular solute-binding protein [Paenibacillus caseinilyticus]MCZ8520453.1 extracellular solute-binding protein [Paenibacillus caseinilyticus]
MNKKTAALCSAVTLTSSLVLSACGGGTAPTGNAPLPDTKGGEPAKEFQVSFRHTLIKDNNKKRLAMFMDILKEVEGGVPGLKFVPEGVDSTVNRQTKLKAEFASGNPPKIYEVFGGSDTRNFVKTGNMLDITPILTELGLKDKFLDLSEFTVDGKIYGLPMAGSIQGFFYNKKIFADLGADVPKSWDEFLVVCEKAKAKGITPLAVGAIDAWTLNMIPNTLMVRLAGPGVVPGFVSGQTKWNDPEVVKAFEMVEDMAKKGYYTNNALGLKYSEGQAKFAGGEAAMTFDGSWANSTYADPNKSKITEHLGFFNLPNLGGKGDNTINGSFSNGIGFSAKADANELQAIKEFIKVFFSEKYQKRQLIEEGYFPSMKLTDLTGVKPIIAEMNKTTEGLTTFPAFDAIVQPKVKSDLEAGMQQVFSGKTTMKEMLDKLQKSQEAENRKSK